MLEPRAIREVTPPDVQRLINAWSKRQAPRTVDRQYDVIRAMFGYAVRCGWLVRSPCRDIKLPPIKQTRRRDLSVDDVIALAHAIDHRYEAMVWLGAVLGLRWGEAAGLTVGSLDLAKYTVTVTHQLGRDGKLAPPKSRAGVRRFSIPTELAELLADHAWESGVEKPDDLLFGAPEGGPLDYSHWRWRVWLPATKKAGLKGTGVHDLRRANASTLVAEGVDIKTAQSRLGHSDPRLTLAVYARAVPEADRAPADALGRAFFGAPRAGSAGASDEPTSRTPVATSWLVAEIAHGSRTRPPPTPQT